MAFDRIGLGTVQFGLDYGMTNTTGKIPTDEAEQILDLARSVGIRLVDTAAAYGTAEAFLGSNDYSGHFRIVTKTSAATPGEVRSAFEQSAARLKVSPLDTMLLHNAAALERESVWTAMHAAKSEGKVENVGVSLYYPRDWDLIRAVSQKTATPLPDVVQLPLSVFDQRFLPLLPEMVQSGVEVHVRSVFLQGLGFANPDEGHPKFPELTPYLHELVGIERSLGLARAGVLLLFPLLVSDVSFIIVGVSTIEDFREIVATIEAADSKTKQVAVDVFSSCRIDDEDVVVPTNWTSR